MIEFVVFVWRHLKEIKKNISIAVTRGMLSMRIVQMDGRKLVLIAEKKKPEACGRRQLKKLKLHAPLHAAAVRPLY